MSDDYLKVHQNDILQRKPLKSIVVHSDSLFSSLSSMKIMSSLMLHHLAALEHALKVSKIDGSSEHSYGDSFDFLTSCILSGLVSVCNLFMVLNKQEQEHHTLVSNHSVKHNFNLESIECANVLANGCFWLSCILNYTRSILIHLQSTEKQSFVKHRIALTRFSENVLSLINPVVYNCLTRIKQAPDLGLSSDLLLRSCLALLRGAVALWHESDDRKAAGIDSFYSFRPTLDKINQDSEVLANDELMGGIDDDILMNINLESVTNRTSSKETDSTNTQQSPRNDSSTKEIWHLLVQTLEQSKVRQ